MKKLLLIVTSLVFLTCTNDSETRNFSTSESLSNTGQGGSLARFTILNNYLYTVDQSNLNVFNITDITNPVQVNTIPIGFNIETLFNYREYLYIGSQNGMYIYSVENPEAPSYLSSVEHFTACDPVVANQNYAFVTLHADIGCGTTINRLEIYDVSDVLSPLLISFRNLVKPIGLGLYGNYLFVCDDEVKIFDVSNPEEITLVNAIHKDAFDVIIQDDLLILIGETGLFQYQLNYANINDIIALSSIEI